MKMMKRGRPSLQCGIPGWVAGAVVLVAVAGTPAQALQQEERQFDVLLRLLPGQLGESASLTIPTANGVRVIRPGSGVIECTGDDPGNATFSVECHHRSLTEFLAYQKRLTRQGYSGSRFRDRLCEAVEAGLVTVPSQAYQLSASGMRKPGGELPDSVTVYHLLQIPDMTEARSGLPSTEASPGSPWLHHGGTCDAHVMWSEVRGFGTH